MNSFTLVSVETVDIFELYACAVYTRQDAANVSIARRVSFNAMHPSSPGPGRKDCHSTQVSALFLDKNRRIPPSTMPFVAMAPLASKAKTGP
jgi:hypothetical protein